MSKPVIVVHYHELWLKGRNRNFFLNKLHVALQRSLEGIPFSRIGRPGDRMIVLLREESAVEEALTRIGRVLGVANYALARTIERAPEARVEDISEASWQQMDRE